MDQHAEARRMLAEREARHFITAVTELTTAHPHPHGPAVRIALTVIDGGEDFGTVDIDVTNLWALAQSATARTNTAPVVSLTTPKPASSRPVLRLLGGGER
ncbi:hypothetical protein [Streptomyces ardesiacus]|uniref:hypothetical protein n=1 Tax=Streptomyces ardesiacus TaxID=285564 RepID=UPI0036AB924B